MTEKKAHSTFRQWDDVVGHQRIKYSLQNALATKRLHHANLMIGPSGIGKRQLAYALATAIHCSDGSTTEACGQCTQCLLHKRGEHPDFVEVTPDGRYIKIDAVRQMQKATRFRPYSADQRVIVMDDAEALREEAANALLKTLEEPSGQTVFVLIAAETNRLLPTILSRCQLIRCASLSFEQTASVLTTHGLDVDEAVIRLSDGSPGRAMHLSDSSVVDERRSLVEDLAALNRRDASLPVTTAERWAGSREEVEVRLEALVWLARDIVVVAAQQRQRVANRDLLHTIEQCAEPLGVENSARLSGLVEEARRRILGNSNARMVFEDMLIETQSMLLRRGGNA